MSTKLFDVITVGELNVDLILNKLEKFPETGKEILAEEMILTLGSSSAIFASNLSSLGAKVSYAGKVGDDSFASLITTTLKEKGVDISSIIVGRQSKTGITVAFNYLEDRAMVTYPGAMDEFSIKDISDEILLKAKHMHLSSVFLQKNIKPDVEKIFRKAKSLGLTTSLDTQWDPAEKWDLDMRNLLPFVDVFLPNKAEILNLTGKKDIEAAVSSIADFAHIVVVKDGNNGSFLFTKTENFHQKAFLNTNVADCIGAGDSFDAGFIRKYIEQKPLKECIEFASVVGAINTTMAGGTTAFKDLDTIKSIALNTFKYTMK